MDIYLVTSNKGKLREIQHALNTKLKVATLNLPEIQSIDVKEVVRNKAESAYKTLKRPVIVEDTGLYLKALNNFPGALIRTLLDSIGVDGICRVLDNFKDRRATAESCFCFYDGKYPELFSGKADGTIAKKPRRGMNDFGWNSIFMPEGTSKTYSEMTLVDKNKISMRAKAVEKLKWYLNLYQKGMPNPKNLLKMKGIIKVGKRVRWSEEIDETLYGGGSQKAI